MEYETAHGRVERTEDGVVRRARRTAAATVLHRCAADREPLTTRATVELVSALPLHVLELFGQQTSQISALPHILRPVNSAEPELMTAIPANYAVGTLMPQTSAAPFQRFAGAPGYLVR
jgi:hypothetical protein